MPSVSVVMPTWNYGRFIRHAVASVLLQTYEDFELIVVDDGSTDDTQHILAGLRDPRLRVQWIPHSGVSAARNEALNRATGEFLAFLDADDLWRPSYLAQQMALLQAEPDVGLSFTDFVRSDPDGKLFDRTYLDWMPELANVSWRISHDGSGRVLVDDPFTTLVHFCEQPIQLQTIVMRRQVLDGRRTEKPIRFTVGRHLGEDREFVMRCWLRCQEVAYIPEPLAEVRRHGSNTYRGGNGCGPHILQDMRQEPMTAEQRRALMRRLARSYCGQGYHAVRRREFWRAVKCYAHALRYPGRRMAALMRLAAVPARLLILVLLVLTACAGNPLSVEDQRPATPEDIAGRYDLIAVNGERSRCLDVDGKQVCISVVPGYTTLGADGRFHQLITSKQTASTAGTWTRGSVSGCQLRLQYDSGGDACATVADTVLVQEIDGAQYEFERR